jgi:uncharacterized protein
LQIPENERVLEPPVARERGLAPAWHTVVLIAGILALSIAGKLQVQGFHGRSHRLQTYGTTAGVELLMLGWVALGVWLRKVPLRALFGTVEKGLRGIVLDFGIAAAFWIGSMIVLGTIGMLWTSVEAAIAQSHQPQGSGQTATLTPKNQEALRMLEQLAPENGVEIGCWALLCCLAGTIEEVVFRGYLQSQFTAWTKGGVAWGAVFSAVLFGAAHGYQGVRNMILLAVFGALFSILAIARRSLRAGIVAHSWHDLITGLTLAFLRAHRLL